MLPCARGAGVVRRAGDGRSPTPIKIKHDSVQCRRTEDDPKPLDHIPERRGPLVLNDEPFEIGD